MQTRPRKARKKTKTAKEKVPPDTHRYRFVAKMSSNWLTLLGMLILLTGKSPPHPPLSLSLYANLMQFEIGNAVCVIIATTHGAGEEGVLLLLL